ncbi:MAG: diheme cytochrome c-553 [Sediminibacterium sp.]|nr:diheme cytochrome c-553 [Sediminibacterium sp.]
MKNTVIAGLLITSVIAFTFACTNEPETVKVKVSKDSLVQRGKYLVEVIGCGDCHTPKVMTPMGPVPDTALLLSGHRQNLPEQEISQDAFKKGWVLFNGENTSLATPGFISYASNLTSDSTGIGSWSFEQFKTALQKGKWKGLENSRPLFPPMPWQNFAKLKEEDVRAIYEYLQSTRPVKNQPPMSKPRM